MCWEFCFFLRPRCYFKLGRCQKEREERKKRKKLLTRIALLSVHRFGSKIQKRGDPSRIDIINKGGASVNLFFFVMRRKNIFYRQKLARESTRLGHKKNWRKEGQVRREIIFLFSFLDEKKNPRKGDYTISHSNMYIIIIIIYAHIREERERERDFLKQDRGGIDDEWWWWFFLNQKNYISDSFQLIFFFFLVLTIYNNKIRHLHARLAAKIKFQK